MRFLTARALGILMLLGACLFLVAAFLELPLTRLLLPVVAYVWIVLGMFWVGMPYLLRDQINWLAASELRWKDLFAWQCRLWGTGAAVRHRLVGALARRRCHVRAVGHSRWGDGRSVAHPAGPAPASRKLSRPAN